MRVSSDDLADVQSWASQHDRNNPGDIGTKMVRVILELLELRGEINNMTDKHPGHDPFWCHEGCPSYRREGRTG